MGDNHKYWVGLRATSFKSTGLSTPKRRNCALDDNQARLVGCTLSNTSIDVSVFSAKVVALIHSREAEEALKLLSKRYGVEKPKLTVGMHKRYSKNPACYGAKKRTIHVSRREILWNPHVTLHEFYHHFKNLTDAQRGIEEYVNKFAKKYLQAYRKRAAFQI